MSVTWADYRQLLKGRNLLPQRPDGAGDVDWVHVPHIAKPQYPAGPVSLGEALRRLSVARRHAPIPHRCGYAPAHACKDHDEARQPKRIGRTEDQGTGQDVYQCPVCHQVMTYSETGL